MKKLSPINRQFIKAAQNNKIDELKNLLDQGADIHAGDDGALKWSAENGHLEVVKFLLSNGANIHADDDYALKWAAAKGQLEVVKFLVLPDFGSMAIAHGANIHAKDDEALRWSATEGHLEIVKFLIAKGANIHANNDGALKGSAHNGHNDVWQVLSAFIQEEKLLVAAVGSTSASSWGYGTEVASVAMVAASDAIIIRPHELSLLSEARAQQLLITKTKRSKI